MKISCPSCDIEYSVKSVDAEDEGIEEKYCPFCGFESTRELNFEEDQADLFDTKKEDWDDDEWHPSDMFS